MHYSNQSEEEYHAEFARFEQAVGSILTVFSTIATIAHSGKKMVLGLIALITFS